MIKKRQASGVKVRELQSIEAVNIQKFGAIQLQKLGSKDILTYVGYLLRSQVSKRAIVINMRIRDMIK